LNLKLNFEFGAANSFLALSLTAAFVAFAATFAGLAHSPATQLRRRFAATFEALQALLAVFAPVRLARQ